MAFMKDYRPEEKATFNVVNGDHLTKIVKVENALSKNGLQMHVITLLVQGGNAPYVHYVVEGDRYNLNMTRIFDAFKIVRGNFNFNQWCGKTAVAHFEYKEEKFTGQDGLEHTSNRSHLIYFCNGNGNAPKVEVPEQVQNIAKAVGGTVQEANEFPEDIPF